MAQASFIRDERFEWLLAEVGKRSPQVLEKALQTGASVIAGEMKSNLKGVLSPNATGALVAAFGITPVKQNSNGDWNVHLGFDGYRQPNDVPFVLIARSFESGAVIGTRYNITRKDGRVVKREKKEKSEYEYWRQPTQFASKAVKSKRAEAERAMKEAADGMIGRIVSDVSRRK